MQQLPAHWDLRDATRGQLQTRTPNSVIFRWVKGHSKQKDVDLGHVRPEDKQGNDAADALATAGAKIHAPSAGEVREARLRTHLLRTVQSMMVEILLARQGAAEERTTEAGPASESDDEAFAVSNDEDD